MDVDRKQLADELARIERTASDLGVDAVEALDVARESLAVALDTTLSRRVRVNAWSDYKNKLLDHRAKVGSWEVYSLNARELRDRLAQLAPIATGEAGAKAVEEVKTSKSKKGAGRA